MMKTVLATILAVVAFSTLSACVSVEREPETVSSSSTTTRQTTIGVPSSATTVERTTVY